MDKRLIKEHEEMEKSFKSITIKSMMGLYLITILILFIAYMIFSLMDRMDLFFLFMLVQFASVGHYTGRMWGLKKGYSQGVLKSYEMFDELAERARKEINKYK